MNHRHLLHAGCLLAASLVFSGCVANPQAAAPAAPAKAQSAEKVVITPEEEVVVVSSQEPAAAPEQPKAAPQPEPAAAKPTVAELATACPTPGNPFEYYNVKVTANKTTVAVGESLSLHVIAEAPQYPISGSAQHAIQVTFGGLDFADAPAVECFRAHPSGSEVIYILTATKAGSFDVTANASIFPTRECSAFSVNKSSAPVKITVK